jgi:hypothetical protein
MKQFIAPKGFRSLKQGMVYHLLPGSGGSGSLTFVGFHDQPIGYELSAISCAEFERARRGEDVLIDVSQKKTLPPWLSRLEANAFERLKLLKRHGDERAASHLETAEQRLQFIWQAVQSYSDILNTPDPEATLNAFARECQPPQNERRFRLWFFVYLAFGRQTVALLPDFFRNGLWSRSDPKHGGKKFGRPDASNGTGFGNPLTDAMKKVCEQGFRRFGGNGEKWSVIHAETLRQLFGAKTRGLPGAAPEFYHPKGEPIPTYDQFRHHIRKTLGPEEIRRVLLGDARVRRDEVLNRGYLTADLSDLMERGVVDSRVEAELPRSYLTDLPLPAFNVVELYCASSGAGVGIGWSLGSELGSAYKIALFCAAIGKERFGALIGMKIRKEDWPMQGLPMSLHCDRGPGGSSSVLDALDLNDLERSLSRSFNPKDNANAESKHPRARKRGGAPVHTVSNHTPIDLIRRSVAALILSNRTSSAISRTYGSLVAEGAATPNEVWAALDSVGRNAATTVAFDDAVRRFLKPVKFTVKAGHLMLKGRAYSSRQLMQSNLGRRARANSGLELTGYVIELAVRCAWVDLGDQLIEVEMQLPIRGKDHDYFVTLNDLEAEDAARNKNEYERRKGESAEIAHARNQFKDETGKEWTSGSIRSGRASNKTAQARREAEAARG